MNRFKSEDYQAEVESFRAEHYFSDFKVPENINKILADAVDMKVLSYLGPEDISIMGVQIATYALYLQQIENRLTSYINWCESNIRFIVGEKILDIDGYFAQRDIYIRTHDTNAIKLEEQKLLQQVKLDQIKNISKRLDYIIDMLKNLSYCKNKAGR